MVRHNPPHEPDEPIVPQNLGAERQVLGGMLVSPETIPAALAIVDEASFYDRQHRVIFKTVCRLWEAGKSIDGITVVAVLKDAGDLDAAGGAAKVSELMTAVAKPSPDHVTFHAGLVRQAAALRNLAELTSDARERALRDGADAGALITGLVSDLEALAPKVRRGDIIGPGITLAQLKAKNPQLPPFLVDGILFHGSAGTSGNTGLLSGPPGSSKTWAALHLAQAVATEAPWFGIPTRQAKVVLFELEMSEAEIEPRCRALDVDGEAWRENVVLFSKDQIPGGQLDICDAPTLLAVIQLVKATGAKLAVFDNLSHLHYLNENHPGEANRIMAALDRIASETGCAVLVLHHDRKGMEGQPKKQTGDSIRGSTVFLARPGCVLGLSIQQGRRVLRFHKVRAGRTPDPIYLDELEDGRLAVTDAPEDQRRVRAMRLNALESVLTDTFEGVDAIGERLARLRGVAVVDRTLRQDLHDLAEDERAERRGGRGSRVEYRRRCEEES